MVNKKRVDFIITGSRQSGNYKIQKLLNGIYSVVFEIKNNKRSGLKECRRWIGEHIVASQGESFKGVVSHQCVKPGREEKKNPIHYWGINQYL